MTTRTSAPPSAATAARPVEPRATTGFGTTGFDALASHEAVSAAAAAVFDVCHVGVALRTVLFVHGVLAIGLLFAADGWVGWLNQFALGAGSAMPAVLLWLLLLCASKKSLNALPLAGQWGFAIGSGMFCGGLSSLLSWWAAGGVEGLSRMKAIPVWLAPAATGGVLAALLFQWLRWRAEAAKPAEATARLAELQSRIRPHFLFNTLNSALALVRLDPARAEDVLEDLAELFRVAIADPTESVTLTEEIELAQRYLAIEQIRFGDRLHVTWELDPGAGHARVPPLLLQPLVENAVRHGIEPDDGGGTIRVRTRVKLGRVLIAITNSVPAAAHARPGNGIALRNVRERLRLMHDVAGQFNARLDGDAYRVNIVVPL